MSNDAYTHYVVFRLGQEGCLVETAVDIPRSSRSSS
jgi:hypothetical protein